MRTRQDVLDEVHSRMKTCKQRHYCAKAHTNVKYVTIRANVKTTVKYVTLKANVKTNVKYVTLEANVRDKLS